MVRVTFLKVWRMYQPGETAAFQEHVAEALLAEGFAVLAEADPEAEPEAPEVDAAEPAKRKKAAADALPEQGTGG